MNIQDLSTYLLGNGITISPSELDLVWPRYDDGDFVEPDLVGPRPVRPPHKPPVKVPLDDQPIEPEVN